MIVYFSAVASVLSKTFIFVKGRENMKKIISIFVFVLIVSVVALAAPYDNSNGEKINAIVNPAAADNFNQFNAASGEILPGISSEGKFYTWNVKSDIKAGGRYEAFLKGAVMRINDEFGINTGFKVPAGKALVFQLPVKNVGNTSSITINAALINSGSWGEANTPIECGDNGIVVTDTENWGIVGFTLVMPGTQGEEYKPRLFFGVPEGTKAGQAIAINLNEPGIPKAFVALEQPYRIKVKSDYYDALTPGESINLTCEVWNQINSKGTLDQSAVTWYVTDSERTQKLDINGAFSFKATDTGITLTVGETAPSGSYCVVAESTENPVVRYGVDFRVASSIPEVEPDSKEEDKEEPKEESKSEIPKKIFADIHGVNHWATEYVDYVCQKGFMNGTGADEFSPSGTLTRAMLVTVLYRIDGSPKVSTDNPFDDVQPYAYYANAVSWAHKNGIVNGTGESTFSPDADITREQIASIIYRYAKNRGYDVSADMELSVYKDAKDISSYAVDGVKYVAGAGIMGGKTSDTINPKDSATRAEAAAIIKRFCK